MWLAIKMLWDTVWGFLKSLPWWLYVFLAAVLVAYLYGDARYRAGQAERQGVWDAAETLREEQERATKAAQADITSKVDIVYRDRVQTVTVKGDTIVKKVPVYVPADSCAMPPGFRLLHDAAAVQGELPGEAAIATAAPASAQDVATTVTENYKTCHLYRAALTSWEEWADEQEKLAGSSSVTR